jgi:TetR/AcrR family transcriptional regulator
VTAPEHRPTPRAERPPSLKPGRHSTPKAERRRAAILDAAEALFAERGFAAARLEDVAERVGIRRASLVYYFKDKQELYDAVLESVVGGLYDVIEPALTARAPLLERIETAVSAWVDYVGRRPTFARLLLREIADGPQSAGAALLRQTGPFVVLARKVREEARGDPLAGAPAVDPAHLASTVAGATVFFVSAMPTLFPALEFDPLSRDQLEAHRSQVLRITRRLLGIPGDGDEGSP